MNILHVDASVTGPSSVSRLLSAEIVAAERRAHPGATIVTRDLAAAPIAHLDGAHLMAAQGAPPEAASVRADIAAGRQALDEFLAADVVVIGAPMYNFSIPSQLKAWIDRLAVAGETFRYTENGPEGLAGGKRIVIASSRGGHYGPGTAAEALDHQESYLRAIFGFFGITDITIVRAEGVAMGEEARDGAIGAARTQIDRLAA